MNNKTKLWILIGVILLLILGVYLYFFFTNQYSSLPNLETDTKKIDAATYNWEMYKDINYGVSFKYPKEWGSPKIRYGLRAESAFYNAVDFEKIGGLGVRIGYQDPNKKYQGFNKDLNKNLALDNFLNSFILYGSHMLSKESIFIDGKKGLMISSIVQGSIATLTPTIYDLEILVPINQSGITLGITYRTPDKNLYTSSNFSNFLSTIKLTDQNNSQQNQVACTQEAKQCPDGSYVSRTGPNCEFAQCPVLNNQTSDWQTYTNIQYGFSFQYPSKLNSDYIGLGLAPIGVVSPQGRSAIDTNGCYKITNMNVEPTSQITLNGMKFCVSAGTEGTAGTGYTTYYYTTLKNNNYYSLQFIISQRDCGAYDDGTATGGSQHQACVNDEKNYDTIAVKPIQDSVTTFKFTK